MQREIAHEDLVKAMGYHKLDIWKQTLCSVGNISPETFEYLDDRDDVNHIAEMIAHRRLRKAKRNVRIVKYGFVFFTFIVILCAVVINPIAIIFETIVVLVFGILYDDMQNQGLFVHGGIAENERLLWFIERYR